MYENIGQGNALGLGNIGGFANAYYWSSTEYDYDHAWVQNFTSGFQFFYSKYDPSVNVRAVRAF
jgi:type 1 glutamine amidotransferase